MSNDTILRLAALPNVVGIKDATAQMARASDLLRRAPPHFALFAGDDETALPFMLLGGHGVISVAANVAPRLVSDLARNAVAGRGPEARAINDRLMPLYRALAVETNPIPVKHALAVLGLIERGIRLPLTELDERYHGQVAATLAQVT
jgi:4-hydroxy-tetrahydrodipicolinate synthase